MKIIVMGGSFNPPTLAHGQLLNSAVAQLQADLGLFVPSDHNYVKRKMKHSGHPQEVFTEAMRLQMLRAMIAGSDKLAVSDLEYNRTEKGRTLETMEAVQRLYPEAELYFLVGADKLEVIPRWHRVEDFLQSFRIAAVARDGDAPEKAICENSLLSRYADRFSLIQAPVGMDAVSSTAVRDLLREGDPAVETMVHPGVWELLVSRGYVADRAVTRFREDYMFLSNFYEAPLIYEGIPYLSSEAAFQAQKCVTEEERRAFSDLRTSDAKRMGRQVPLRPDWEEVKRDAMEGIVRAKFSQNPELAKMLLDTGDKLLLEGNTWHDTYWGIDLKTHEGENHLGQILMQIRRELREKM